MKNNMVDKIGSGMGGLGCGPKLPPAPPGPFCQSCGRIVQVQGLFGTEASGALNLDYCRYCYDKGEFLEPELTKEEMTSRLAEKAEKKKGMEPGKAKEFAEGRISKLKRWKEE